MLLRYVPSANGDLILSFTPAYQQVFPVNSDPAESILLNTTIVVQNLYTLQDDQQYWCIWEDQDYGKYWSIMEKDGDFTGNYNYLYIL